ncbi:hypothetical protein Pyn_16745 [Prunus yedoensis var. nudiflora]|uniref:Uncharacterized protein n=2 Tax=Prunus yedoensis var. nudiflora TaxID=2094558 RepID=A0A315A6J3_PRUYE|nr:hypothetical protein Pyn_16745 [Prunus yedoensis var. nudiflora]
MSLTPLMFRSLMRLLTSLIGEPAASVSTLLYYSELLPQNIILERLVRHELLDRENYLFHFLINFLRCFWSIGRFRCDGEGDFWRNVRGLMCFRFLGIYFWWKIGGSLCAAMLNCVVVVYPLLCGHYGTVSVPFAEDGGFVLYFGLIL